MISSQNHRKRIVGVQVGRWSSRHHVSQREINPIVALPARETNNYGSVWTIQFIQVFKNVFTMIQFPHVIHHVFGGGGS